MILYDMVLEDLPERVRELTVRLRDLVLSLGPGIEERVKKQSLEYAIHQRFAVLTPDRTGVTLEFAGPFEPSLNDPQGRLEERGNNVMLRMASAAAIDDALRRICREVYSRAQARDVARRAAAVSALDLDPELQEALQNVSRGLRLLIHHQQAMEKAALQKQRSLERAGQKRSHKKKPPPTPPVLVIGGTEEPPPPPPPVKQKAAAKKQQSAPKKKTKSTPSKPVKKKAVAKKKPAARTKKKARARR